MLTVVDLRGASAIAKARLLAPRRPAFPPEVVEAVSRIVVRVRSEGDAALIALTVEHDGVDLTGRGLTVSPDEMSRAA